jgi:erythromycin esterase
MLKFIICIFFIHISLLSIGQNHIKKYVRDNDVPIYTIEPDSIDFSDLQIIGNAIGDSKIVMLGEQDHGDAPTFLAKTRIIKYLHEKKGFNVLAFESDFFGLNYGWDVLNKNKNEMDTFIRKNIFPIWTDCNTCKDLFYNYIPETYKTGNPLIISGFDSQVFQNYSSIYLSSKLDSVIKSLDLPISKRSEYSTEIITRIDTFISARLYPGIKSSSILPNCVRYLTEIKNEAGKKLDKDDFWMIVIENLIRLDIAFQNMSKKNYFDFTRDSMMALNLK